MPQQVPTPDKDRGGFGAIAFAIAVATAFIGFGFQNFSGDGKPLSFPSKNVRFLIPQNDVPLPDPCEHAGENVAVDFKFGRDVGIRDIVSIELRLNGESIVADRPDIPSATRACGVSAKDPETIRVCGRFSNLGYASYHVRHVDGRRADGLLLLSMACAAAPQPFPDILFDIAPHEMSEVQ